MRTTKYDTVGKVQRSDRRRGERRHSASIQPITLNSGSSITIDNISDLITVGRTMVQVGNQILRGTCESALIK